MFRLFYLTFAGMFRGTDKQKQHLHESPKSMTIPLIILAVLSVAGGLLNIPAVFGGSSSLNTFLSPIFGSGAEPVGEVSYGTEILLMSIAVIGSLAMIGFAWFRFVKTATIPVTDGIKRPALSNLLYHKYYIDEIYQFLIEKPVLWLSDIMHLFDVYVIDKTVNFVGNATVWLGKQSGFLQTGNIGFYLIAMVLSIVAFLVFGLMI